MAKAFKPQSPATIERNRLRKQRQHAKRMAHPVCSYRGQKRKQERKNITAWKERREARRKMLSINPEERFHALKVLAHLERQEAT